MTDFWLSSGHHLLDRSNGGGLVVTDEFLKAYLARPELVPPANACVVERTLHAALLADPRRDLSAAEIAAIVDADARENWQVMIAFRDHLLRFPTIEAAYLSLARGNAGRTPHMFLNQLVHVILRNVLDGCDDAYVLRAAELFFRPQRVSLYESSLLAADEERIGGAQGSPVSPLVGMLGFDRAASVDVLGTDNAATYLARSDRFDMALDLTAGRSGLAALARVMERWIAHMLHVNVAVAPLVEVRDAPLTWYVGLDPDGTRIGDALWHGETLDEEVRARIVGLFAITFNRPQDAIEALAGEPTYAILATTPDKVLRLKPQNLLVGLPIRDREAVS